VSLTTGNASILTWSVKNATAITITPDVGTISASGTKEVKPASTTTYTLAATNASGTQSKTVEIKVLTAGSTVPDFEVAGLPTIETFSASPASVISGHSSTLTWSVKDATSVMITPDAGTVSATGTKEVKPSSATTYTIVASNGNGMRSKSVTVSILTVGQAGANFGIVETKKPDLVIHYLAVVPKEHGSSINIAIAMVKNNGTAFSTQTDAMLEINDKFCQRQYIPAIEPGETWTIAFDQPECKIANFAKVKVTLDPGTALDELNENNNSASMIYMP